ncbi:MAG: flagellar protein FlaG [Nitrosomonas sp.]|nr:flagellar protein FlaG [Nitrosomonas sp.]MDP1950568.1 flagellar protein FlaG [Nitrosomonas sp.]
MTINQIMGSNGLAKPSSTPIEAQRLQAPLATNATPIPAATSPQKIAAESIPDDEQVQQAVDQIKGAINKLTQDLRFSIDEETGKTVVKILDSRTQEVIRQFPTEEALSIARTLDKVQGLLFNDKA